MIRYSVVMEASNGCYWQQHLIMKCFTPFAGLSPDLHDFEQIRSIARPTDVPDTGMNIRGVVSDEGCGQK